MVRDSQGIFPLELKLGLGMHPYGQPLWQRFLVTDKGVVLVVLVVGTGQPAQLRLCLFL